MAILGWVSNLIEKENSYSCEIERKALECCRGSEITDKPTEKQNMKLKTYARSNWVTQDTMFWIGTSYRFWAGESMILCAVPSWQMISTTVTETWNQLRPGYDMELAWKITTIVRSGKAST